MDPAAYAADDDHLAAEGHVLQVGVDRLHQVAQRAIERLEVVAVAHRALVPQDELRAAEELCGHALCGDVEHLIGRGLERRLAARVEGAAELQQDGGDARGGDGERDLTLGAHGIQQAVCAERLPSAAGRVYEEPEPCVALDRRQRRVDVCTLTR